MLGLLKAMATTSGAGVVTILFGLFTTKIVALVLGPAGVGLLASYRQVHDMAAGIGILGGGGGQVQALSSTEGEARRRRVIASIWLSIVGAAIMAVVLLAGADPIARHFFHDPSPNVVAGIRLLPLAVSLTIAVVTLQGLLNVARAIGRLALTQVAGAAILTALAWPLAQWAGGGSQPAFVVIVAVPALVQFALVVIVVRRLGWGLRRMPRRCAAMTRSLTSGTPG